jgi:hypothetical protein
MNCLRLNALCLPWINSWPPRVTLYVEIMCLTIFAGEMVFFCPKKRACAGANRSPKQSRSCNRPQYLLFWKFWYRLWIFRLQMSLDLLLPAQPWGPTGLYTSPGSNRPIAVTKHFCMSTTGGTLLYKYNLSSNRGWVYFVSVRNRGWGSVHAVRSRGSIIFNKNAHGVKL